MMSWAILQASAILFNSVALVTFLTKCAAGDVSDVGTPFRVKDVASAFQRNLAIGDFAELNQLIKPAILRLPDTSVSRDVVSFNVRNLRCTSFQLGDMTVSSRKDSASRVSVPLNIIDLDMVCTFDYRYWAALIFRGGGTGSVTSSGSDIFANMAVLSTNPAVTLATSPPDQIISEKCEANVVINRINFQGGVLAWIANIIEGTLRGKLAEIASVQLCQALDGWSKTAPANQLETVAEIVSRYPPNYAVDPLALEHDLAPSELVKLLNLQEREDRSLSNYVHLALDEAVTYLRGHSYDFDDEIPDREPTDLNINVFLRNQILDAQRALSLDASDLSFLGDGGLLWEGTDRLTKTLIYINQIKVKGFDTFTQFHPLVDIGKFTIQNQLSWEYLQLECDATFVIRPSDRDDSVLINPGKDKVVERATLSFRIDEPSVILSLLLGIDRSLLQAVEIGSLLQTSAIVPCLLSTIFNVAVSCLELNVNDTVPPSLLGFVSPGIDRVFGGVMDATFVVFRELMLARLPAVFNIAVRNFLNGNILTQYRRYADSTACTWSSSSTPAVLDGTVDLRDLLLSPDDALASGASGQEPYGDLFSSVLVPMLGSKLMPTDGADGLPLLNDHLVKPLTKMQSGEEGTLAFNSDLFAVRMSPPSYSPSTTTMELQSTNFTIENLDIIQSPINILKPTGSRNLSNRIALGPLPRKPLILSSKVVIAASGDDSPLNMYNNLELQVSLPESELIFDIFAAIQEDRLLAFPLQYIDNYHCWLDTVLPFSQSTNAEARSSLDLSRLFISLSDIRLSGRCIDCSSLGLLDLNDILTHIQDAAFANFLLQARLERLAEEIIWEYWQQMDLQSMLDQAPSLCPYGQEFDGNKMQADSQAVDFKAPALSLYSLETITGILTLLVQTGVIVAAKSHSGESVSDPLSSQKNLDLQNNTSHSYVDLNGVLGFRTADYARGYLTGKVQDKVKGGMDLGINVLLRRFFLDSESVLTVPVNVTTNVGEGTNLKVNGVRIKGLSTVSTVDTDGEFLEPIGPQTLKNSIVFERVEIYVDILVEVEPDSVKGEVEQERMAFSVGLNDVRMDLSLLFAVDQTRLSLLELGSLMLFNKAPDCLLSLVIDVQLTQFIVQAGSIDSPQVEGGLLSTRFHDDLNSILSSTNSAFYNDMIVGLPLIFDGTVRKISNEALGNIKRDESQDYCNGSDELLHSGLVDFRDLFLTEKESKAERGRGDSPYGDLLRMVYQNLNKHALNAATINSYVHSWTKSQSGIGGSAWYEGDIFESSSLVKIAGFAGRADLKVSDPMLENVDIVAEPLVFLEPVSGISNELSNIVSFGDGEKRFQIGGRVTAALSDGRGMNVHNELDVGLSFTSFSYLLHFFLNLPQSRLYRFPLRDFFNINCWLAAILSPVEDAPDSPVSSVGLVQQDFHAEGFTINIKCVSCSSPRFDDFMMHLYSNGKNEGDNDDTSTLLNAAISSVIGGGFLKDRLLIEASRHCPHNDAYNPDAVWGEALTATSATTDTEKAEKAARDSKTMWFNVAMSILTAIVLCLVIVIELLDRKRHQKWVHSLDEEGLSVFSQQQAKEDELENALSKGIPSLFCSMDIPRSVRYGVPLAIVSDIGLFAAGHFAAISAVDLTGHVAGEAYFIEEFLSFSFISSIIRTYRNGGNEMAIFMLIFSGLYPYLKLLVLSIMWFVPPRLLGNKGIKRRGKFLLWMDVLAKLSVIDIITLLLLAAVILVFAGGPTKVISQTEDDVWSLYSVEAIVTPAAGFYCCVMAQRISRIGSKYLLEWHHRIVAQVTKEYEIQSVQNITVMTALSTCSAETVPPGMARSHEEEKQKETDASFFPKESNTGNVIPPPTLPRSAGTSIASEPKHTDDDNTKALTSNGWLEPFGQGVDTDRGTKSKQKTMGFAQGSSSLSNGDELSVSSGRGCVLRLVRLGGTAGAVFSAITVCFVFVIGIVIAPSIRLDTRSLLSLVLESGKTFGEVIQSSFFRTISLVLLQARFIMQSRGDYIGLVFLFCLVGVSSVLYPLLKTLYKIVKWQCGRRGHKKPGLPKTAQKPKKMPHYIRRLYLWQGMDVYIVSFVVAVWQLGTVAAYAIHLYCTLLESLFSSLAYAGLVESSEAQCFRIQASLPSTVFIICTSFVFLSYSFYSQASGHYQSNRKRVEKMIETETLVKRASYQSLSSNALSSSFWNLGATQLVEDGKINDNNVSAIAACRTITISPIDAGTGVQPEATPCNESSCEADILPV